MNVGGEKGRTSPLRSSYMDATYKKYEAHMEMDIFLILEAFQ